MNCSLPIHRRVRSLLVLGVGASVALVGCSSGSGDVSAAAGSEGSCAALEGENISLVVPYEPGGGYDSYARMLAPYLEEEIGAKSL